MGTITKRPGVDKSKAWMQRMTRLDKLIQMAQVPALVQDQYPDDEVKDSSPAEPQGQAAASLPCSE